MTCFLSDAGMELFRDDLSFQSQEGLIVPLCGLLDTCNELWAQDKRERSEGSLSSVCSKTEEMGAEHSSARIDTLC